MCPLINLELDVCFAAVPFSLIFTQDRSQILCVFFLLNSTPPYPNVVICFEALRLAEISRPFSGLGFLTRLTMSSIVGGCISRSGDGYPLHYEER